MLELPPNMQDPILVDAVGVRDVGLTDRDLSSGLPPPIEVMRNRPTSRLRHERFQSDDVLLHPLRLGLGEDSTGW
jgi:hypothetical protein